VLDDRQAAGGRGQVRARAHTRSVRALVTDVRYRLEVTTLRRDETSGSLGVNEIGRVTLRTTAPVMVDLYRRDRVTGSLIVTDEVTSTTAGEGTVLEAS